MEEFNRQMVQLRTQRRRRAFVIFGKYISVFVNLIYLLIALILMGIGGYALYCVVSGQVELKVHFPSAMLAIGSLLCLCALLGVVGTIRENRCALITYLLLLFSLIVSQLAIGAAAMTYKIQFNFKQHWDTMNLVSGGTKYIETTFDCCGWDASDLAATAGDAAKNCAESNLPGCSDAMSTTIANNIRTIGLAAIVFGVLQVGGLVSTCTLIRLIQNDAYRRLHEV